MGTDSAEAKPLPTPSQSKEDQRFSIKPVITDASAREAERVTLKIQDLSINGFVSQNSLVANFRNIQYARIPGRWHQAVPIDPTKEKGVLDATQWGPRPPQPVDVLHDATRHLYPRMSTFDRQSEFECLNLNVCSPMNALSKKGRGLPVLVWIHGGAFVYGDGGCESDGQYLVRRSIELGEPILVVGLNYRLGILGFLSSKELREEARTRGEVGFNNLGLHDQRVALQWIQKNIHFFGGDGSRVTVAGESAGACSILAHLRGQVPVFQNALLMSPAMLIPGPLQEVQHDFDRMVAAIGLSDAPTSLKLSALRSISPSELNELVGGRKFILSEDSDFFSDWSGQRWEELSTIPSWAKGVVVGETKAENVLFSQRWATMSAEDMYSEWDELYSDRQYAEDIFSAYGITKDSTQAEIRSGLIAYTSDALFAKVVYSVATTHLNTTDSFSAKVYLYSFDQPDILSSNPVFQNSAYHSQDNSFLFCFPQVTGPSAPAEFRATADTYSGAALKLVNSHEPWEEISVARRFMSINGDKSAMLDEAEGNHKRWKTLVDTPERMNMFSLGHGLLSKAARYAMTLPIDVHRK